MYVYDFFEDLKRAPHDERDYLFDPDASPGAHETKIDRNWRLELPVAATEQIRLAAEDLTHFLGFELKGKGRKQILLELDPTLGDAETYAIAVKKDEVRVTGADASGLMYGVFYLEGTMKFRGGPILPLGEEKRSSRVKTRIFRSPMAFYYQEELDQIDQSYPETYLREMARHGFNGIWLRGILRELVKSDAFPEFGARSKQRLSDLRTLVARGKKYGIGVYLYFTEPLGFSLSNAEDRVFADKYPDLLGDYDGFQDKRAMCSSHPETQRFLREGMNALFAGAPGLGGVILITANEHHTHCYTSKDKVDCPRCSKREKHKVVAEVIALINEGVKAAAPTAKVIAWNWSWRHFQPLIIAELPKDVILMADFERGGKRVANGVEHVVDEYSLNYVGPSERFRQVAEAARTNNLPMFAKLQIDVTHEIATVPYFPVLFNLIEKCRRLKSENVTGAMNCWNFGNFLCRGTELVNWFSWEPSPDNAETICRRIAARDFGEKAADHFVEAWKRFSEATAFFPPFDNKYLYSAPTNFGGAYPLFMEKVGQHLPPPWLLPEIKYNISYACQKYVDFSDQISDYSGTFGPEKVIAGLRKFCSRWDLGLTLQKDGLALVPPELRKNAERELAVCSAVHSQLTSAANITEFFHVREAFFAANNSEKKAAALTRLKKIAADEIDNALLLKTLIEKDRRLGFHGEAFGYFYTPEKIDAKIRRTRQVLDYTL